MIRVFLLFFFSLSFALLSVEEIQKRIDEAYVKEQEHIESERMNFTNTILPVLEKAIIEGRISRSFGNIDHVLLMCDGKYGDIRPDKFCEWWKTRFNKTLCSFLTHITHACPLVIRFEKE